MKIRPKNMPRWQWNKSQEEEKGNLLYKKSLEIPYRPSILGIIITTMIMLSVVWLIFASMGGEPEYTQDICDGSNRTICP